MMADDLEAGSDWFWREKLSPEQPDKKDPLTK